MAENDAGMSRVVCVNKGRTETVRELSHSTLAEEGIHVVLPESRSDVQRHELSRISRCFRHQLLLPSPYLVLTKSLRLDIQCQRAASVKIGWKYLDD